MAISVLIADDHPMIRSGLDELFSGTKISVIAVASNAKDAVAETVAKQPDVVLLDVRMTESSGLEALEEIKQVQPQRLWLFSLLTIILPMWLEPMPWGRVTT